MAYTAATFSAFEQPTTSKWNLLWANDAFFNTQVGTNFSSGTTSTVWWEELGRTTLSSNGDLLAVSSFPARKFLQIRYNIVPSGQVSPLLRFNSDSTSSYAQTYSSTYGTAVTQGSVTGLNVQFSSTVATTAMGVIDVVNIANAVKVGTVHGADNQGTASAADVPIPWESALKWINSSVQITTVSLNNGGTGDYAAGTSLVVLGHD